MQNHIFPIPLVLVFSLGVCAQNYTEHVKPILQSSCLPCHQKGGIGNINLSTYESTSAYGAMIEEVVATKYMPPWSIDRSHINYENDRRLSTAEIDVIRDWCANGMVKGQESNATSQVLKYPLTGGRISIPVSHNFKHYGVWMEQYQNFILDLDNKESLHINALEFIPGNSKIVRAASFYLDQDRSSTDSLDQWDPREGYTDFDGPGILEKHQLIANWEPDMGLITSSSNSVWTFGPHSRLIAHVVYAPSSKQRLDNSLLHLHIAEKKSQHIILGRKLIADDNKINKEDKIAWNEMKTVIAIDTLQEDIMLRSIYPRQKLFTRSIELFVKNPQEGKTTLLLHIEDYNPHWNQEYILETPLWIPAGSTIHATYKIDNSLENPLNPFNKATELEFGSGMFRETLLIEATIISKTDKT